MKPVLVHLAALPIVVQTLGPGKYEVMPVGLIPVVDRKLNGLINVPRLPRGPAGNGAENLVARHPVPLPGTDEDATVKLPPKMPHEVGVCVTPLASKLRKLPIK